jgi:hypothetical protein
MLASLLAFTACAGKPSDGSAVKPHTPCHEPFEPTPPTITTDDSALYRALAEAVFEGVSVAAADDFTYEAYSDGIRLLTYVGEGGAVVLPDEIEGKAVVALGSGLFQNNTALTHLLIPDSVREIGEHVLTGARFLQVLKTPQLSPTREASASGHLSYFFGGTTPNGTGFRVPSSLDTVILASAVTSIPDQAFYECSRLRMVFSDTPVERIGKYAFYGCNQLHTVDLGIVKSIGDFAFGNCTSLASFSRLGATLGKSVLYGCTGLTSLTLNGFGEDVPHLGALFGAETHMWNSTYVPKSLERVSVEGGNIPDNAFYGCEHLKIVELAPSSTTQTIGSRAFYGCTALQKFTLPDSTASVGDLAFAHCTTLASVTLSSSLTDLGIQAFMGCTNLTEITLPEALTALPSSAFADCCNLRTVALGKSVSTIGAQAFRNCASLITVTGGKSDMLIAQGNDALTSLR